MTKIFLESIKKMENKDNTLFLSNPETTVQSPTSFPKMLWFAPLLLAVGVGLFTINGDFVQDDPFAIRMNPLVIGDLPWWEAFRYDFWGVVPIHEKMLVWRPLLPIIWSLFWKLGANGPLVFRVLSLFFHVGATASVLWAGWKLLKDKWIVWTTGMIFAVHAIHAEAIGGLVSQADILSAALGLCALSVSLDSSKWHQGIFAALLLGVACLAKETAIVFGIIIAVLLLIDKNRTWTERLFTLIPALLITIFIVAFQLSMDRHPTGGALDNLARDAHGWNRMLYGFYIIGRGIMMCFVPIGLAANHGYAAVDFQLKTLLPYAIPGFFFLIVGTIGLATALIRHKLPWVVGLCLLFGPVFLHSNLIVTITTDLAERLLYTSSIASCAMTAMFLYSYFNGGIRKSLIALTVVLLTFQCWQAQRPWRNNLELFHYAVESEPLSWRARHHYGANLFMKKRILEGTWYYMTGEWIYTRYEHGVKKEELHSILWLENNVPLEERLVKAPFILYPQDPCLFVASVLYDMQANFPNSAKAMQVYYTQGYGKCVEEALEKLTQIYPLHRDKSKNYLEDMREKLSHE